MNKLLSKLTKAIISHKLIENGDTVAVGISGGKDSLMLLKLLADFKKTKMIDFNLIAITICPTPKMNFEKVQKFCDELNMDYTIEQTDIFEIVFDIRKEKNPCSLCAKMRRGALCETAKKLGANKLALGHHSDDLNETFILSLIFEGRLSTFSPKSVMTRTGITVIRPLIYLTEDEVASNSKNLPIVVNPCPADKHSKREEVKSLIAEINKKFPKFKENLNKAITNPNRNNLWEN